MYMRNALVAAVGLQYLVEGILAQDKVTLTKTVTKRKPSTSVAEEATEDITTVVPTSYITDGTTIWVDETITIPCSASACTATTTGSVDADSAADGAGTSSEAIDDGNVTDQTADITTVVPTSYIVDGTTIFIDETITIPCTQCEATETGAESTAETADANTTGAESTVETADANTTAETADAASTSEPIDDGNVTEQTADITTVVPTSYVTDGTTIFIDETITIPCTQCAATETGAESTAETADANTTTETAEAATSSFPGDDGRVTEQTADITTVVPTTYVTEGTTITEEQTIIIPCTKCAATKTGSTGEAESTGIVPSGDNTAETSAASETQSVASSQDADGTTSAEETGTRTAGTASDDAETSTEVESTIPTSFSTNILSTGFGGSTATGPTGLFPNTSIAAGTSLVSTVIVPAESTLTTGEVKTSSTAVASKIPRPVIVVIREVTIFHRTIVIGAACPPVKAGSSGNFIVGRDSEEKSFNQIGDALTDACNKQFKACSSIAGKNFRVADCQKQLTNCLADAASTAKAPTPVTKESTETASIILPSDATITGESKSYIGNGNVVISTRTLTVSESCEISDGTPVIKGPTATGETAVETTGAADAETTGAAESDAETTGAAESDAESTQDVATTEASEEVTGTQTGAVVTSITMTNSNGEVTVTAITLTTGQPTGTGAVSVPTGADSTQDVATTEATEEVTGTQGVESSGIVITMTKSNGEISLTSITLGTAGPSGTGVVSIPSGSGDETTVPAPEATDSSAIGQGTTVVAPGTTAVASGTNAVPSGTNGVVTVTVGGNTDGTVTVTADGSTVTVGGSTVTVGGSTVTVGGSTVTQTVTDKVTETETVTVGCGANGSQSAATVISVVTTCPPSTTLATQTTRAPETVYVTEVVEYAQQQTPTPDSRERLRRMLGFSW